MGLFHKSLSLPTNYSLGTFTMQQYYYTFPPYEHYFTAYGTFQ